MISIKTFDSNLLKLDKNQCKNIHIYYIGYITIKNIDGYENIYVVNPLYLIIGKADGYIEESNKNTYLAFASTDQNKEVLTKFTKHWDQIKYLIKTINGGKEGEYKKGFMKIKFNPEDNLPLNKTLKVQSITNCQICF